MDNSYITNYLIISLLVKESDLLTEFFKKRTRVEYNSSPIMDKTLGCAIFGKKQYKIYLNPYYIVTDKHEWNITFFHEIGHLYLHKFKMGNFDLLDRKYPLLEEFIVDSYGHSMAKNKIIMTTEYAIPNKYLEEVKWLVPLMVKHTEHLKTLKRLW